MTKELRAVPAAGWWFDVGLGEGRCVSAERCRRAQGAAIHDEKGGRPPFEHVSACAAARCGRAAAAAAGFAGGWRAAAEARWGMAPVGARSRVVAIRRGNASCRLLVEVDGQVLHASSPWHVVTVFMSGRRRDGWRRRCNSGACDRREDDTMRKERKGKERKGKERKGKERKGKERKGKERKGKERKGRT